MKNLLIISVIIMHLFSCNSEQPTDSSSADSTENNEGDSLNSKSKWALWEFQNNPQTNEFELVQLRSLNKDSLSGQYLEQISNTKWPQVQMEYLRTSQDTAFLSIPDSEVLTQQMGSAGARSFMISTTYNFTELKGGDYVFFDFIEGDHAAPGTYNRSSWDADSLKIVKYNK